MIQKRVVPSPALGWSFVVLAFQRDISEQQLLIQESSYDLRCPQELVMKETVYTTEEGVRSHAGQKQGNV